MLFQTSELEKTVKSHLNKLTTDNMAKFVQRVGDEALKCEESVKVVARMVHDKACIEYKFAALYAEFAKRLQVVSENHTVFGINNFVRLLK